MKKRGGRLTAIFVAAAVTFTGTGFLGGAFAAAPQTGEDGAAGAVYDIDLDTAMLSGSGAAVTGDVIYFTSKDTGILMHVDEEEPVAVESPVTLGGSYRHIGFSGVKLAVILDGVTVDGSLIQEAQDGGFAAVSVTNGAAVTFALQGENTLRGGSESAGLYVAEGASIVLRSSSNGSLEAMGGASADNKSGAGIGGNRDSQVGSITIESGNITAVGGPRAAGIGSGYDGGAEGTILKTGDITIHGGTVRAEGGLRNSNGSQAIDGAGIGTGCNGQGESQTAYDPGRSRNEGTILIDGGSVYARGHSGIGGGNHKSAGTIRIEGSATVDSYAVDKSGAGIGGGLGSSKDKMKDSSGGKIQVNGGDITIGGSARVNACGAYDTAGIGGGLYGDSGSIRITDNAVVYAKGGYRAAGIGGGYQGDGNSIELSGNAVVRAFGGTGVSDKDAKSGGAGIGGGVTGGVKPENNAPRYTRGGNAGRIAVLDSADVVAVGGWGAAGIGSGAELRESDADAGYELRHTAGSITIGEKANVSAFSDGTKWAVDLVCAEVSADGLTEENAILQGRFRANDVEAGLPSYTDKDKMVVNDTILDWDGTQPNGAYPVMDGSAYAASTNTVAVSDSDSAVQSFRMPVNYRSFARTGFRSGTEYAIRLTSGAYPAGKWISGVLVEGAREASDATPVTGADQRRTIYRSANISSSDDLAFTLEEVKPKPDPKPAPDPNPDTKPDPDPDPKPDPEPTPDPEPAPEPRPGTDNTPSFVQPTPEPFPDELGEIIAEEEVPLAQLPALPDEVTIVDEDVPLGKLPTTGFAAYNGVSGISFLLAGAAAVLAGFFFLRSRREKKETPEA